MALADRPRSSSRRQRRNDPPAYSTDSQRRLSLRNEHTTDTLPLRPIPRAAPYRLGQSALPEDIVRFQSVHEAHSILPTLPIGTPLFVKRSNKDWTYARIVSYRRADSAEVTLSGMELGDDYWNEGKENFIVVALDEDYLMRKFIQKEKWHSCVRLVRLAKRGNGGHANHYARHNSQPDIPSDSVFPKLMRRSSAPDRYDDTDSMTTKYSPNRGQISSRHGRTSVVEPCDDANSVTASYSRVRGKIVGRSAGPETTQRRLSSESRYFRQSSMPESNAAKHLSAPIPKSRSAVSFETLEKESFATDGESTLAPVTVRDNQQLIAYRRSKSAPRTQTLKHEFPLSNVAKKTLPAPIVKVKSAPDMGAQKESTPKKDDVDSTAGVADHQRITSTALAATETNPYVRSAEKNELVEKSSVDCAITNSPCTDSTASTSSPASVLGPAKVNLRAKHFCGKRRDRMRPQRRTSTNQ